MCREVIYWGAEILNYWALMFWGIKIFLHKYKINICRNNGVTNILVCSLVIPMSLFCAGNYNYVLYSNSFTYFIIIYILCILKVLAHKKLSGVLSGIAIYINCMRLIDLWIVAVVLEVSSVSRNVHIDLIHMGWARTIFLCFLVILYYVVYRIIYKTTFVNYLLENRLYRWSICLYSFLGIICFYRVYRFDYSNQIINYWTFYLVCAFIFAGTFLAYIIRVNYKEREKILNIRNYMIETNYQGLKKIYEENRTLQHDHRNHMLAISELIKDNKNKEAIEYICKYIEYSTNSLNNINSGNDIVDIIVNSKIAEAIDKKIEFEYKIGYIGNIFIEDIDMCALFANLLDNAIEACEKIEHKQAWIFLKISRKNDMLLIQLNNSINQKVLNKKFIFESDKDNSQVHGWGMKSIERVVNKYGGMKEYFVKGDFIEVFLNIPI